MASVQASDPEAAENTGDSLWRFFLPVSLVSDSTREGNVYPPGQAVFSRPAALLADLKPDGEMGVPAGLLSGYRGVVFPRAEF